MWFLFYSSVSRTLTSVHDAILEDLVFPSEIVGKRIRVKMDCSRLIKVHLDKAQQNNVEHKVSSQTAGTDVQGCLKEKFLFLHVKSCKDVYDHI